MTTPADWSFNGGSTEDQAALSQLYRDWLYANGHLDQDRLRTFWSADPDNVFFNNNGFVYRGLKDWLSLWSYLGQRMVEAEPSTPSGVRVIVRGDMAVISEEHGVRRWRWFGQEPAAYTPAPFTRSTLVCVREAGAWMVVHAHFSPGKLGTRPGED